MRMNARKSGRNKKRGVSIKKQKKADALAKRLKEAQPNRNSPYSGPVVRDSKAGRLKLSGL